MARSTVHDLFRRHHLALFRFLRRMTGDPAHAEDLVQEVFVRVVRGLEAYEDREREESWLFRIARNLLHDDRRAAIRHPAPEPLDVGYPVRALDPDRALDPVRALDPGRALEIDEALAGLPAAEREAFLLREQFGLGYAEIAGVTGATADAVRNRIYRARTALRRALAPGLDRARPRAAGERHR